MTGPSQSDLPLDITEAAAQLRAGTYSSVELLAALTERAERSEAALGVYVRRDDEAAREAAAAADADFRAGTDRGPLQGIPLGIKDILATREGPTTAQSLVHDPDWERGNDAGSVHRLRKAGAVLTGKLATLEFAVGMPDPAKPYPPSRNPWDARRWAGGSSSGSGNATAAGLVLGALGTDTGGSIRVPAASCGVSGHKPTYGLVSKTGCVPLGYSMDHVGPLARTVRDCAIILDAIAGFDPADPCSLPGADVSYVDALNGDIAGLRIGVIRLDDSTLHPEVPPVFDTAIEELRAAGADCPDVVPPLWAELIDADFVTFLSEGFAYQEPTMRRRAEDYGTAARRAFLTGALYSGADYLAAQAVRRAGLLAWQQMFHDQQLDAVVVPTNLGPAPLLTMMGAGGGTFTSSVIPLPTAPFDSLGTPALTVPMGFTAEDLPLGMQIVTAPMQDALALRIGDAYQRSTGWHLRRPPFPVVPAPDEAMAVRPASRPDPADLDLVTLLLQRARLPVKEADLLQLAAGYPVLRAAVETLHQVDAGPAGAASGQRFDPRW